MKVILTKDLENVGKAGALVDVKPGFGRNYLLPRQLAMPATAKNIRQLEHEKSGILARAARQKSSMDAMAKKISAIQLKFSRKVGEQDKLFGSVTSKDIHDRLAEQGYEIDRKQIHLPKPPRTSADHEVKGKRTSEGTPKLKLTMAADK